MHLTRVTIENIRAIERLELDLSTPSGQPRRRVILLGANGSGKTTILTAISHAFASHPDIPWLLKDERLEPTRLDAGDVRQGSVRDDPAASIPVGTIELGVHITAGEREAITRAFGEVPPTDLLTSRVSIGNPARSTAEFNKEILWFALRPQISQPPCVLLPADRGTLVPTDRVDVELLSAFNPRQGAQSSHRARFDALPSRLALAFAAPARNDPDGVIARMWKVMEKYFPDMPRPVDIDGLRLLFETDRGTVVTLPQLSDGQRAVLLILGELALRNPASGVVLIDEIEQHLHPRWQRAILDALIAMLPSTQFILTSQAPYIAASAPDDVVTIGDWERDGID